MKEERWRKIKNRKKEKGERERETGRERRESMKHQEGLSNSILLISDRKRQFTT